MAAIIALDAGTTSTRAIAFTEGLAPLAAATERLAPLAAATEGLAPLAAAQVELPQHFPRPGWVEHEPEDIAAHALQVLRDCMARAGLAPADVAGIGIANQRETALLWERATGRAVGRAIVWQDRRTAGACDGLRAHEARVSARTGLRLDPYFSATKLRWMLDATPGAREAAARGALCFGTVDSFLLFRLTEGGIHATDATNAARTLLMDLRTGQWDPEMLDLFGIPPACLPEIRDCAAEFGTARALGGGIAIRGMAGDQQAATIGQACFAPGMVKSTYGTGCFVLLVTGAEPVASAHRLLSTVAWQLDGRRAYALEGSIFSAGAAVQWLRDGLGLIAEAREAGEWAARADPAQRVHLVPAFTGLGAPHWDAEARAALLGLTRGTTRAELCRAALESVAFQTADLLEAMRADWPGLGETVLRVDGGMVASDWTMQFLSDLLGAPVDRPAVRETTALGAAWLAGHQAGLLPGPEAPATHWRLDRRFEPGMARAEAEARHGGWKRAVERVTG